MLPTEQHFADIQSVLRLPRGLPGRTAVRRGRAIAIGGLLVEAKALVDHGGWNAWVEENCPFDRSQAARYIKAHADREAIRQMRANGPHLGDLRSVDREGPEAT
jgi:hypothetical protein